MSVGLIVLVVAAMWLVCLAVFLMRWPAISRRLRAQHHPVERDREGPP